ncbi:structural maintenance of chromosomes protein 4 [Dorcoceras hygrometricum]|uniref:Structural maintenance of chromosomes protein 4 n=1 Tax=Dorcoceras hygrometricum TaxID=472368 RepID=A0A2Z7D7I1_9LAMI|nr:structural maintenance of chromosomes protein 4 [Dorcoceras hygrometricum]
MEITTKELTSLTESVSYLTLKLARLSDDTNFTRLSTVQLWKQLENAVAGLEIRIDVLESTLSRKFADSHQEISELENALIRHFADNQQHIVDEVASLKSQC